MAGSRRGALLALIALVALLVVGYVGYDVLSSRQETPSSVAGEAQEAAAADAPAADAVLLADHDATVYTDLGEPLRLSTIADGRPLVINFWATWCPYCVQEMPDYLDIYRDYADCVSFAFVGVTDGQRETKDAAMTWLSDNGFAELPAYFDSELEASTAFGAWSLPTTVVVSADGEVLTISAGAIDPTLMRGALNTLV